MFDHHARGFEGPCLFDLEGEGEGACEVVFIGWVEWVGCARGRLGGERDAHGLDGLAACDLEERGFGLGGGVAGEELGHAPADGAGFECAC